MSNQKRLNKAAAQLRSYNELHEKITRYQKKYVKALKECWTKPINPEEDMRTLERHGLGNGEVDYEGRVEFYFDDEILRLNQKVEG